MGLYDFLILLKDKTSSIEATRNLGNRHRHDGS